MITVLIADGQPLQRLGFGMLLDSSPEATVLGEAEHGGRPTISSPTPTLALPLRPGLRAGIGRSACQAVASAGWTLLTVTVAAIRGATVSEFLIAVLLPMMPALLDAADLCQAHWRAGAESSALEDQLDQRARGRLPRPLAHRAVSRPAPGHRPVQVVEALIAWLRLVGARA